MQLFRNMEVVLMLVFGVVCATVFFAPTGLTRATGPAQAVAAVARAPAAPTIPIPTVHVIGRRLAHVATAVLPTPTLPEGAASVDED